MEEFEVELACIPSNSDKGVYVPWSVVKKGYYFASGQYGSTDLLVSEEDIAKTLKEIEKLGQLYPPVPVNRKKMVFLVVWLVMLALFGGSIAVIVTGNYTGRTKGSAIAISLVVCFFLGWVTNNFLSKSLNSKVELRKEERRKASEEIIDRVNSTIMIGKKASVRVSRLGAFIAFEHCGSREDWRVDEEVVHFSQLVTVHCPELTIPKNHHEFDDEEPVVNKPKSKPSKLASKGI